MLRLEADSIHEIPAVYRTMPWSILEPGDRVVMYASLNQELVQERAIVEMQAGGNDYEVRYDDVSGNGVACIV